MPGRVIEFPLQPEADKRVIEATNEVLRNLERIPNGTHGVVGNMCGGKSDVLSKVTKNIRDRGGKVITFQPDTNTRDGNSIRSRSGEETRAFVISDPFEVFDIMLRDKETTSAKAGHLSTYDLVVFDEVNFFHPRINKVTRYLNSVGVPVIAAFLNTDYKTEPFRVSHNKAARFIVWICGFLGLKDHIHVTNIGSFMAQTHSITNVYSVHGEDGYGCYSEKVSGSDKVVEVDNVDAKYEPRILEEHTFTQAIKYEFMKFLGR